MKRVMCLYRVSTKGQVDPKDDIPMQRRECMAFIERQQDWTFVGELMEKGVSGYKVSIQDRDAIIEMRAKAEKKEFDVLLVFMFDRLGRREDETPFLVQWFIEHGIEVWSTREGQQRLDNRVDKLMNYIRFWQAGGESEKTSIRVKAAHTQMTADCIWRGGNCPFGYKLVHRGRIGKKNRQLYDLEIDEQNGPIIQEIFELYGKAGFGALKICNHLNQKYPDPAKVWVRASIMTILRNPIYTGRLHMNDTQSQPIDSLRLISDQDFEFVQRAIHERIPHRYDDQREAENILVPDHQTKTSVYGASLLSGLIYCKHCGCKLTGSYCVKQQSNGPYFRPIYRCFNNAVAAKGCHGQTVYSAKKLEGAIREAISPIFDMLTPDMNMAWEKRRKKREYGSSQTQVRNAEKNLEKLEKQRLALEHEVVNSLTGESNFETSFLTNLIATNREAIAKANMELERIRQHTVSGEESIQALNDQYQGISDWKTVFDHADLDSQKMFLARIIKRIEVDREYHVTIYFNMPITMKCA